MSKGSLGGGAGFGAKERERALPAMTVFFCFFVFLGGGEAFWSFFFVFLFFVVFFVFFVFLLLCFVCW